MCKNMNIISSLHIIIYISIYIHVATTYINEFVWIDRSYYIQTYHTHMVERREGGEGHVVDTHDRLSYKCRKAWNRRKRGLLFEMC